MDCCGLSSTGLQNIDANEITSDNVTIYSRLNVSGYSFFNNVLVNNNSSLFNLTGQENLSTTNNNNKPLDLNNNHMASNNNKNVKIASCLDKWYKELKGHVLVIFFSFVYFLF